MIPGGTRPDFRCPGRLAYFLRISVPLTGPAQVVPVNGTRISFAFSISAVPLSEMGQSDTVGLVPIAVAVHVSVEPDRTPCAVPEIAMLPRHVAVNDPETVLSWIAVTIHWKFVHVFGIIVVDETDDQTPLIACTPVTDGVFDEVDVASLSRLVQPAVAMAATSIEANSARVMRGPTRGIVS